MTNPLCKNCNMPVKGSDAQVPLFDSGTQWGIHIHSDKFTCFWNEDYTGPRKFATV